MGRAVSITVWNFRSPTKNPRPTALPAAMNANWPHMCLLRPRLLGGRQTTKLQTCVRRRRPGTWEGCPNDRKGEGRAWERKVFYRGWHANYERFVPRGRRWGRFKARQRKLALSDANYNQVFSFVKGREVTHQNQLNLDRLARRLNWYCEPWTIRARRVIVQLRLWGTYDGNRRQPLL